MSCSSCESSVFDKIEFWKRFNNFIIFNKNYNNFIILKGKVAAIPWTTRSKNYMIKNYAGISTRSRDFISYSFSLSLVADWFFKELKLEFNSILLFSKFEYFDSIKLKSFRNFCTSIFEKEKLLKYLFLEILPAYKRIKTMEKKLLKSNE